MPKFKEPLIGAIGIGIQASDLPSVGRYQKLSQKLAKMGGFRRLISWRLRGKHKQAQDQVEHEYMEAVMKRMAKKDRPRGGMQIG